MLPFPSQLDGGQKHGEADWKRNYEMIFRRRLQTRFFFRSAAVPVGVRELYEECDV
jgi:hypothetical protein